MQPITKEMFTWCFKDPDWKNKFLIGSVLVFFGFIPIVGWMGVWAAYGYALIVMRAMMRGETPVLPKWENYGKLCLDGFKAVLSQIGYYIPGFLTFAAGHVVVFAVIFAPVAFSTEIRHSETFIWGILAGQLVFMGILGIAYALWMLGVIPTPVAVGRYLHTGKISCGYQLRQVWKILRANVSGYFIAWVLYYALAIGIGMLFSFVYLTIILCCFLPFLMAPVHLYLQLMHAYLFGIAYREGCLKAGIPLDVA